VLNDPVNLVDPLGLKLDVDLLNDGSFTDWLLDNNPLNNRSNAITTGGHGNKSKKQWNLAGKWHLEEIQDIANQIKNTEKYKNNPNMPIEIEACYVGATNIPQIIADETGIPVKAYQGSYYSGYGFGLYPKTFYPRIESGKI